jgi:hypothetical protein
MISHYMILEVSWDGIWTLLLGSHNSVVTNLGSRVDWPQGLVFHRLLVHQNLVGEWPTWKLTFSSHIDPPKVPMLLTFVVIMCIIS